MLIRTQTYISAPHKEKKNLVSTKTYKTYRYLYMTV